MARCLPLVLLTLACSVDGTGDATGWPSGGAAGETGSLGGSSAAGAPGGAGAPATGGTTEPDSGVGGSTGGAAGDTGGTGHGGDIGTGEDASTGGDSTGGTGGTGGDLTGGTGGDATGGSAGGPGSEFNIPARLSENGTCWMDEFPNPVCKDVPVTEPPIITWHCAESIGVNTIARLRIPPGTCLRVYGRFDPSKSWLDLTCGAFSAQLGSCRMLNNWSDEDSYMTIYSAQNAAQGWTAWWNYTGECLQCEP
jgi:hypothetical protein